MNEPQDLGEQALGKAAELAIKSQLDAVDAVEVDVHTDPLKLVQGKVDAVAVSGEGMVMKQALRVDTIELQAGAIAIDPLKAILGQLELTEPTQAQARVYLTEADLNHALASDYLLKKMQALQVEIQGQPQTVNVRQVHIQLPGEGQLILNVDLFVRETGELKHFSGVTKPGLKENGHRIELEILSVEGQGLSLDFVSALLSQITDLLDLRNFDLQGNTLRLDDLHVAEGKLGLRGMATIEQIPSMDE